MRTWRASEVTSLEINERVADKIWNDAVIGFAFVDRTGKFLRANPQYCRIVGYTETELKKRTFSEITVPDDVEDDEAESLRVASGKQDRYDMQKTYVRKDRRTVTVRLTVTAVRDPDTNEFVFFFSQVSEPRYVGDPAFSPPVSVVPKPNPGWAMRLIRQHWTWILGTIAALIGFGTHQAIRMDRLEQSRQQQEKVLERIMKKLEDFADKQDG